MSVVTKERVVTREAVVDTAEVRDGVKYIDGIECWSAEKATKETGRPRSTLDWWAYEGKISKHKIGRKVWFEREQVEVMSSLEAPSADAVALKIERLLMCAPPLPAETVSRLGALLATKAVA